MADRSRRGPEKQRALRVPTPSELLPEARQAEEQQPPTPARAAQAALVGARGSIAPATARSLAGRVGNRRLSRWVAAHYTLLRAPGLPEPEYPDPAVAGATARPAEGEQASSPALWPNPYTANPAPGGAQYVPDTLRPNPYPETARGSGGESADTETSPYVPNTLRPNPYPTTTRGTGGETAETETTPYVPATLRPNPYPETARPRGGNTAETQAAPYVPATLRPNPYPNTTRGMGGETAETETTPYVPATLRPNPYPNTTRGTGGDTAETEATQAPYDPDALRPNPYPEVERTTDEQALASGLMPNPFGAESKTGGYTGDYESLPGAAHIDPNLVKLPPLAMRPNPFGDEGTTERPTGGEQATTSGLMPNPFGTQTKSGGYTGDYESLPGAAHIDPSLVKLPPLPMRPNPFGDGGTTERPTGGEQASTSGLMPNPFGTDSKSGGVEEQTTKASGSELTPSGLMPNPFGSETKADGYTGDYESLPGAAHIDPNLVKLPPLPMRPNPFDEGTTQRPTGGEQASTSGLMPNPFGTESKTGGIETQDTKAGATELTPSGLRPNPFGDQNKAGGVAASDTKAGGTELTPSGPRDTAILGPSTGAGEQGQAQAAELATTARSETDALDESASQEATQAAPALGPAAQPQSVGQIPDTSEGPSVEQGDEGALTVARGWIERAVSTVVSSLNPIGAVLAALRAIGSTTSRLATSLSAAVSPVWRTIAGGVSRVITFVSSQAASLMAAARSAAARLVGAVASLVAPFAQAALGKIRQLRTSAYGQVVQMVQSARQSGIAGLTSAVSRRVTEIHNLGEQIRGGVAAAVEAAVTAIRSARDRARSELDRLLGSGGQTGGAAGGMRRILATWARTRLQALPRALALGRRTAIPALRRALEAGVSGIRELWARTSGAFVETFSGPLAEAGEQIPELVGEAAGGLGEAEEQVGLPAEAADQELGSTEEAFGGAEERLRTETDAIGASL